MNTAIIFGFIILGICLIGCAFILSGAISGAATAIKNTESPVLQQPTMRYLTEFDAADYLGVSLNELDYMRSEGLLDNTFIAVTSREQTGDETYTSHEDGVAVTKNRPVVSSVTRFLFDTELLDKRMRELILDGQNINPSSRRRPSDKPAKKYGKSADKPETSSRTDSDDYRETKSTKSSKNDDQRSHSKQGGQSKNGQGKSGNANRSKNSSQSKRQPVTEDDSDMKIAGPASPVYSSDDTDSDDVPVIKPSSKGGSRPRIAVIPSDEDDM